MTSVVVFDYGFGNVRSMVRALANLGLDVTLRPSRLTVWSSPASARSAHA